MLMSDFKAQKFLMHVNGCTFDVYPDTASIVAPNEYQYIQDLFRHSSQVDTTRMIVLADFYKVLDQELKARGDKDLTKEELEALYMECIPKYYSFVNNQTKEWERISSTLESLKEEVI
jgi:hypothetical protein